MRNLRVFNHVSLDGFIADREGDMGWAHSRDPEFNDWVADNASGGAELVFGRVTYQQMVSFWPTPEAQKTMKVVAERMNSLPKCVFSKTLTRAEWNNTRLFRAADLPAEVQKLKEEPGQDLLVMGSANLIAQLAAHDLVDSWQVVLNPIALGAGKSMFSQLGQRLELMLTQSRTFKNGNVVLWYERKR